MEFLYKPLSQIVLYLSFFFSIWGFYLHNKTGKVKIGLPSSILLEKNKSIKSILFNFNLSVFCTGTRYKAIRKIQIELHEYQMKNNRQTLTNSYFIQALGPIIDTQFTLTPDSNKIRYSNNFILPPQTPLSVWISGKFCKITNNGLVSLNSLRNKMYYEIEFIIYVEKDGILKEKTITFFSHFQYLNKYIGIGKNTDFIPIPITEGRVC